MAMIRFCSQNTQSTRASSLGIYDTDFGENEEIVRFAPNSQDINEITSILFSEDDPLECQEPFDLDLIKRKSVKDQTCVNQFKLLSENKDSGFLEEQIKSWESNLNKPDLEEKDEDFLQAIHNNEDPYLPNPLHLNANQSDITESIRAILIDWMIEVCADFSLKRDTLYIAANYVDRYLSIVSDLPKWELQQVGITSLFMASKMEVKTNL